MAKTSKKMTLGGRLLVAVLGVAAVIFLPTTILLVAGMLPTIVARVIDRSPERLKAVTVGCMNFAGCFPFWFEMVQTGHKVDNSLAILTDPLTIVVIYSCAVIGYLIEWICTIIVSGLMVQRGKARLELIKKTQEDFTTRWGPEVSGDLPLDDYGFPVENK
jgi:hypothetical protein